MRGIVNKIAAGFPYTCRNVRPFGTELSSNCFLGIVNLAGTVFCGP